MKAPWKFKLYILTRTDLLFIVGAGFFLGATGTLAAPPLFKVLQSWL